MLRFALSYLPLKHRDDQLEDDDWGCCERRQSLTDLALMMIDNGDYFIGVANFADVSPARRRVSSTISESGGSFQRASRLKRGKTADGGFHSPWLFLILNGPLSAEYWGFGRVDWVSRSSTTIQTTSRLNLLATASSRPVTAGRKPGVRIDSASDNYWFDVVAGDVLPAGSHYFGFCNFPGRLGPYAHVCRRRNRFPATKLLAEPAPLAIAGCYGRSYDGCDLTSTGERCRPVCVGDEPGSLTLFGLGSVCVARLPAGRLAAEPRASAPAQRDDDDDISYPSRVCSVKAVARLTPVRRRFPAGNGRLRSTKTTTVIRCDGFARERDLAPAGRSHPCFQTIAQHLQRSS
jgi:hypothetical protein